MAGNVRARGTEVSHVGPDRIRNVVLVGHASAGKTTLVESLLVTTGAIGRAGRVEDASTVCRPRERRAPAGSLGLPGRRLDRPRRRQDQPGRHPRARRLRRGGARRPAGGRCRPVRGLRGGRRRRCHPDALGGVRGRRDAARSGAQPHRPATGRRRGGPGDLPAGLRRGRAAALPAGAGRCRAAGRAARAALPDRGRLLRGQAGRDSRGRRAARRRSRRPGPRWSRGSSRSPRTTPCSSAGSPARRWRWTR